MDFDKDLMKYVLDNTQEFFELLDEQAEYLFAYLVDNAYEFKQLIEHEIRVKDEMGDDIYIIEDYRIDNFAIDCAADLYDGISFMGAVMFENKETLMLDISVVKYKIEAAWCTNMENNREVPIVSNYKLIDGIVDKKMIYGRTL